MLVDLTSWFYFCCLFASSELTTLTVDSLVQDTDYDYPFTLYSLIRLKKYQFMVGCGDDFFILNFTCERSTITPRGDHAN